MKKNSLINGKAEQQYHRRDEDLSDQIIDSSRSMISIINLDYTYEKVNSTFCREHKKNPENILGKTPGDLWGDKIFIEILKEKIDACFMGNTVKYEASFATPNAGRRYFEVLFSPITGKDGRVTHILAETFDINDLKKSEETIRQREEELKTFETNLPIGFIRCDMTGNIIKANKAFNDIIQEEKVTGTELQKFYAEDGLFTMQVQQLLVQHTKCFGNVQIKNSRGKEISCRVSGFLETDDSGNTSFIDFAIEDSSRELMLENRLMQAQKMETIGALAGGIAHDFNNILATISGYSEMLMDDLPSGSDYVDKVAKIQSAVMKAKSIINQMLVFSRQVEQEKIAVSVAEVLRETIGFVKSSIPGNIVLKSRLLRKELKVLADPTQLFRVFLNLMTNAIQAMEDGGGILSVSMSVIEGKFLIHDLNKDIVADEYVVITFRDTGKGMDPNHMRRIFEPFFSTGKGTGLGLSVIQGIITEVEGEILVTSRKGKGSVFHVYLPVVKYQIRKSRLGKTRILFITGNRYESRILSLALKSKGHELIYVSDRKNLIKVLAEDPGRPDLIIYMSDSKQIHKDDLPGIFNSYRINIPCILITDPVHHLSEENLLNSGIIKQQLIKPVSLKEITNAIDNSLNSSADSSGMFN